MRLRELAGDDQHRAVKAFRLARLDPRRRKACKAVGACSAYLPSRTTALGLRLMFLRIRLMPGTLT
jgi:hypothetical protein